MGLRGWLVVIGGLADCRRQSGGLARFCKNTNALRTSSILTATIFSYLIVAMIPVSFSMPIYLCLKFEPKQEKMYFFISDVLCQLKSFCMITMK